MFRNSKLKEILKKKEVEEGKQVELEKGDIPALIIAACSVFLPIILLFIAGIALIIWIFTTIFN